MSNLLKNLYCKMPHIIVDEEAVKQNFKDQRAKRIRKPYKKFIDVNLKADTNAKPSNFVWTCWFQGLENAPAIVKTCVNSAKKVFENKEVVVITKDNYKQYTDIPAFVIDKWEKGIISNTHFSDILRTELLCRHGGLWLDATVLCTGDLNRYIDSDAELFLFRNDYRRGSAFQFISSWLIYAKPSNPILVNTRKLLYEYWKRNNKLKDYFLFHIFFSLCAEAMPQEWAKVPFYTNIDPHVMQFYYLLEPYDEKVIEKLKNISNFHKLSYKYDKNNISKNSLFSYLSDGGEI